MPPPRGKRASHPASSRALSMADTRASSVFPYSTARPPTNYSDQSWVRNPPPLPSHVRANSNDPFLDPKRRDSTEEDEEEGETPLYARSDWNDQPTADPTTAHSRGVTLASGKSGAEGLGSEDERSVAYDRDSITFPLAESPVPMSAMLSAQSQSASRRNAAETEVVDVDSWREEPTAWTQSSWAGAKTAELNVIREEDSVDLNREVDNNGPFTNPASASPSTGAVDGYGASYAFTTRSTDSRGNWGGRLVDSLAPQSSAAPLTAATSRAAGLKLPERQKKGRTTFRSSLPSVLSLGQLARRNTAARRNTFHAAQTPNAELGPFGVAPLRTPHLFPSPSGDFAPVLSPSAQQKLGRMSVAAPRYSLPPPSSSRRGIKPLAGDRSLGDKSMGARIAKSELGRWVLTYRPLLNSITSLVAALILTVALTSSNGIGGFVILHRGAFATQRGEGEVTLGVAGWCGESTRNEVCSIYREVDFASQDGNFRIPGSDSLLHALYNTLAALTATCWLHALFSIITTALHWALFFGLSVPFGHLIDAQYPSLDHLEPALRELHKPPVSEAQAEVDLRVRCERPPYESWEWVWWAWWAHKRGPVGHLFGGLVGLMALSTLGIAVAWKRQIGNAADGGDGSVEFGSGTFVPLITLIVTLESFVASIRSWINARASLRLFTSPPDPTPAVVLLPPGEKPMRHVVPSHGGGSFFAPRTTIVRGETLFADPDAPPLPSAPLDEETVRWLAAYPKDSELVPLIAGLKAGKENADFVLSDVGLLYLRPEGDENALLVPPRGTIREELMEDVHLELLESADGDEGVSVHYGPGVMYDKLNETFWWATLESDVDAWVKKCRVCNAPEIEARERLEALEDKTGMTAVPFTGITGWTGAPTGKQTGRGGESAMAVEMAFAMRKADEEARQNALG